MKTWDNSTVPVNVSRRDKELALNTTFSSSDISTYAGYIKTTIQETKYDQADFCHLYANITAEYQMASKTSYSYYSPKQLTGQEAENNLHDLLERIENKLLSNPVVIARLPQNSHFEIEVVKSSSVDEKTGVRQRFVTGRLYLTTEKLNADRSNKQCMIL